MKMLIFCAGDSSDVKTWSNVPYLLTREFEEENTIIRINTNPIFYSKTMRLLASVWNRIVPRVCGCMITFNNTRWYNKQKRKLICKAFKEFSDADIAFSFDFGSDLSNPYNVPTVLFSDWTVEYHLKYHARKKTTRFEARLIKRQERLMENATYCITLFPGVYKEYKYRFNNIRYLGFPVNNVAGFDFDEKQRKNNSNRIVFIGSKKYEKALFTLIETVKRYNDVPKQKIYIDIIGIESGEENPYVCYHGYLDKSNPQQLKEYHSVIYSAKYYINTTPNWVGASSLNEALSHGVPAIICTNIETKMLYPGKRFIIHSANSSDELLKVLETYMSINIDEYRQICMEAISYTQGNTWKEYSNRFFDLVSEKEL